ncbi:MAG: hypothetical protein HY886_06970 [Deltaproteobacteria bacterium]|nr:hypothetical protein [Deltaproteobacteria bacterium]
MKAKDVPQEMSQIGDGNRRACYAQDEHGNYVVVRSIGWHVEDVVNAQAHVEIDRAIESARLEVLSGVSSPLKYHMLRRQMTVGLLAATTGFWRFTVSRHLKLKVFDKLGRPTLERYADCLRMTIDELKRVPATQVADDKRA